MEVELFQKVIEKRDGKLQQLKEAFLYPFISYGAFQISWTALETVI
jgi:hypothetical protein